MVVQGYVLENNINSNADEDSYIYFLENDRTRIKTYYELKSFVVLKIVNLFPLWLVL